MRSAAEVEQVQELAEYGLTTSAIARSTGIPRATVRDWLAGHLPASAQEDRAPWRAHDFPQEAYAYLLGLYLGDGYLAKAARTWVLRIFFDAQYPGLIGEAVRTLRQIRDDGRVRVFRTVPTRCVVVQSSWKRWPLLLPQHGRGLKHQREIRLETWQREITAAHSQALVRGLLHSDGCRFTNTVRAGGRTYSYPRYFFTNASDDIKGIFCEHLDLLGVAWRRVGPRNISIARRDAVAALDEFVGPKR